MNCENTGAARRHTLLTYPGLWLSYLRINWLSLLAYNIDFLISASVSVLRNVLQVLTIGIIFDHVGSIGGWSFAQVLYVYALAATGRSIWHLFAVNVLSIGDMVRNGGLERLMVRPANVLFQVVADYLDNDDWGELFTGVAAVAYAAHHLSLVHGPLDLLLIVAQMFGAAALYLAFHLTANTLAFWLVRTDAAESLIWTLDQFTRYPLNIYGRPLRWLMTWVVPFGFVSFYPAQAFFSSGMLLWVGRLSPFVAAAVFALAYRFWQFGLSRYQGTGS